MIKYINNDDDDDVGNENRNSTSCYRAHQEGTGKRHGKNPKSASMIIL